MTFANPAGLWLLALAVPVVVLHLLRPARRRTVVSSTFLWQPLESPVSAARPWQRLDRTLLLLLQLLAVALLAVGVAQPVRRTPVALAAHTVFVVDASGSMAATDGDPDRLADARARARDLRAQLPGGGAASIVVAGPQPRVALTASSDERAFAAALDRIDATAGTPDFPGAFALAESLETPGRPIGFVLLTDGTIGDEAARLIPPGTIVEPVGREAANRSLAHLSVEERGSGLHARVHVVAAGTDLDTDVRFSVDGADGPRVPVRLAAGEGRDIGVDLPGGTRVTARLGSGGTDLLALDDEAVAVAGRRRPVRVLVAGPPDPFLDSALAAVAGVTVERRPDPAPAHGFDLAVYDRVAVPADPGAPFVAVAPPGGAPGVTVDPVAADKPALTLLRSDDPLLADLDLAKLAVATAQKVSAPAAQTLLGAEGVPLLLRGTARNRPFAYLTFALGDSNLPVDIALPLLMDRLVTQLAGAGLPPGDLRVGDALPLDAGVPTTVVGPDGTGHDVAPGAAAPEATATGFWTLRVPERPERVLAVNPSPDESAIAPVADLAVRPRRAVPGEEPPAGQRPVLAWVAAALLAVLLAEFLVARRRVGVPRPRWRAAVAVRAAVALLVVAAVAGLAVVRPAESVATVFLVDASASLGAGRDDAVTWVQQALAAAPDDARAGIALFGGDARLEATVQEQLRLGRPAVQIDDSRTNLATALRLAAAVLPADARRRVVLVSDGRPTDGDATAEARRLAGEGVQVDVHTVARRRGPDRAVARVDAPAAARDGDRVEIQTRVEATVAGPAVVALDRDGELLEERTVDLRPGSNAVSFSVVVRRDGGTATGLHRYRVRVLGAGPDAVLENDAGYASVRVEAAARVLVVEGVRDRGALLANALRAGGLPVDVVAARHLPPVDELSGYASVVLVDVHTEDLSTERVEALAASTRDLGHGLVTVGGTRAYGLGGYRHSALEDLLPVISEVQDPDRRQSIAQVLAIDVSGSMGEAVAGGASKNDLTRAGAARAIAALEPGDEVGIIAVNTADYWVMDLQPVPGDDVVKPALERLAPDGGTDLSTVLLTAAEKLRKSSASVKHIVLFTDGWTAGVGLAGMSEQARLLAAEGITVSVVGAGEGTAPELESLPEAGRGRYYPADDPREIPEIMQEEVEQTARSLVIEGELLPKVVGADPVVRDLTRAPALKGYVATTPKPSATTPLRIGEYDDPLLASWTVGLGRATSWMSDSGSRWAAPWASWDGFVSFWSGVVKDTFPSAAGNGTGAVRARLEGDRLVVRVESAAPFPDGAAATARVIGPDLVGREVPLVRTDGSTFAGEVAAAQAGTYAVGAVVTAPGGPALSVSTLATRSYAAEYAPGDADPGALAEFSAATAGRGEIAPDTAFDPGTLPPGRAPLGLTGPLLLAAALLWPVAVALSRLAGRRGAGAGAGAAVGAKRATGPAWIGQALGRRATGAAARDTPAGSPPPTGPTPAPPVGPSPGPSRRPRFPAPEPPPARPEPVVPAPSVTAPPTGGEPDGEPSSTVERLLARKRRGPDQA